MQVGTGRKVVPGDVAICHCICTRREGDVVFASPSQEPYVICVGARDSCVGIEYGLLGMQIGGIRTVKVPPNLTYIERKIYIDIPEDAMLVYELKLIDLPEKCDSDMASRLRALISSCSH
ncbi:MAG: FKBP-type peptidyl-prolyl cis-trans isomerase [Planctomycetaceae bacterium]